MRRRVIQTLLLAVILIVGIRFWREHVRAPAHALQSLAERALTDIFGPDVTYDAPLQFDLADGALIRNLRVPSAGGRIEVPGADGRPRVLNGLEARRVAIRHDALALAAGRYRPLSIEIEGATILTRETDDGIAPDFPFELSDEGGGDGVMPRIAVRDATLLYRAQRNSKRLAPGGVLRIHVRELTLVPDAEGVVQVRGRLHTLGLGQDDTVITLDGTLTADRKSFDLVARWDPLEVTPALLAILAEDLAAPLRSRAIQSGTLALRLKRKEGIAEGAVDVHVDWNSEVELTITDVPGFDEIDATTREQLSELFGRAAFQADFGKGRVNIKSLVAEMAGGRVRATGWVVSETGEFQIDFEIRDLRLEDPAVRRALGEEGSGILDEFDPSGLVDADGHVTRSADGEVVWSVDVFLEDVDLRYVGSAEPDGKHYGFPYRVHDATGRVRIRPEGVTFDEIVGFNRGAEVRILGRGSKGWLGHDTGFIDFAEDGTRLRLSVVATNVPVDEQLQAAIEGSEFVDVMDDFDIQGVIDKIEVDLHREPTIELTAKAELRITLEGEQFRYVPFPLPLEDVRGQVTLLRPIHDGMRGRVYAFDVTGWAEGAPIRVSAEIIDHESRGRLHVRADGLPLAGIVTQTVLKASATAEGLGPVWTWLGPRGKARLHVDLPLSDDPGPMRLDAEFQGASIRLDARSDTALEIADLAGDLQVVAQDVTLHGVTGTVGGSAVTLDGEFAEGLDGTWRLDAEIEPLKLTPSLVRSLAALAPGGRLLPGGLRFESGSRMALSLHLTKQAGAEETPRIAFTATDLDTVIRMPDGAPLGLSGASLAVDEGVLTARGIEAEAEGLVVHVPHARVVLGDEVAITGRFEIAFDDYVLSEGFLDLLPPAAVDLLATWMDNRRLRSRAFLVDVPAEGPVTLRGDLALIAPLEGPIGEGARGGFVLNPLVIHTADADGMTLEGLIELRDFTIDVGVDLQQLNGQIEVEHLRLGARGEGRGRIAGISGKIAELSVSRLSAPVDWTNGILRIPAISGTLAGGELVGDFVMHTADPVAYEGNATVRGFDVAILREDLAPSGPAYEGKGTARVTFQNRGGASRDLTAAGEIHIRRGRLGDLPLVANVFTLSDEVFGVEKRPQFERADVEFKLEKEIFTFGRLDLAGPLFDMPGKGTLDLNGVVDLRFTPDFIKGMLAPGAMQIPGVGTLLRGLLREEVLYAVRVHGDLGSTKTDVVPLPLFGYERGSDFEGTGARSLPRRRLPGWFR